MSYSVRVEDFDSIQQEWERLLPSCSTNTIFVTPWWQRLWWRHFGDGAALRILSVRHDDDLAGVAPLSQRDGVMSFLGDTDLFDYGDFLVRRGNEEIFYDILCDFLVELDWHTLVLKSLPQGSPTLTYIPSLAESKGFSAEVVEEDMAPVAALPASWDEYLAGLTRKDRHELRRKLRRLENADSTRQYTCESPETIARCMEDFLRLLRASGRDKIEFMTPEREAFFLDVARELTPRGQFKLYFLEVNDVRVASSICFDYAGAYLLYNSGYDPDYSSLSVGLVNKALCIRDAIEEGRHSFDFLRGTERYKYDLGGQSRAIYQLVVRR